MEITPTIAKAMLAKNGKNYRKKIDKLRVSTYAKDLASGAWDVNGTTIGRDYDDNIHDGQHRLCAVVESGCVLRTWVWTGPCRDVSIDVGKPRSIATVLDNYGVKQTTAVAAALRLLYFYQFGPWKPSLPRVSSGQLHRLWEKNRDISAAIRLANHARLMPGTGKRITSESELAFVIYVGCQTDVQLRTAEDFVSSIANGDNLQKESPVFVFRRMMLGQTRNSHYHSGVRLALLIKTWNASLLGNSMKILKYQPFGVGAESMPRIITINPDGSLMMPEET